MSKVLITGINGFVGHHLAAELAGQGHDVIGSGTEPDLSPKLSSHATEYFGDCDLTDPAAVAKLPLDTVDTVINLAGLAQVGASEGQAEKYHRINVAVHTVLADRVAELDRKGVRIIAVSTGAVYDNHQSMPLNEDSQLISSKGSPYALSKIAMERALKPYSEKGLDIIIVRPFNHIGPGQLGGFLVPDLTSQVTSGDSLLVGDLTTERDYTDVRDVVRAYAVLATSQKLDHNLYNICSGKSISGQAMLDEIIKASGKDPERITVEVDQTRLRPNDPKKVVGNNSRLRNDTGWEPTIPLAQTITDTIKAEV